MLCSVRILLPPSETKSFGGNGPALDLSSLSFSSFLLTTSQEIATELRDLCRTDPAAAQQMLGLSDKQRNEIEANAELFDSPTAPAINRYTGVLYDAFDFGSLTPARRQRALDTICIGSALFGLVSAGDLIPHYRLSASSSLGDKGTFRSRWAPAMRALAESFSEELVVDMRSGGYRNLGPIPGAVTVNVVSENAAGERSVITHFNKHYKGVLARALVSSRARIESVAELRTVARRAGLDIERPAANSRELTMVVRQD